MQISTKHQELPSILYCPVEAAQFPKTRLVYRNLAWAQRLKMDAVLKNDADWCDRFGRFTPFDGAQKQPLALCYHGHQFGVYNPDLGDGRGFLYAQIVDAPSGRLLDFGTKGSGKTPFSRQGDGRLTLKGAVRELLASAMLDALGVNTSKTFAIIETGEALHREDEPSPTRAAVLTRLSHSHIRIGTFQRLAYLEEHEALEALIRYTLAQYYGCTDDPPIAEAAERLLVAMTEKQAELVAHWLGAGFVHGVLNSDNFNITGESFDYGPWRFLPRMDANFTAAYFDYQGRYCYGRQGEAAFWALCRLADCFVPFLGVEALEKLVGRYHQILEKAVTRAFCRRLGIDADWDDAPDCIGTFLGALRGADVGFDEACFDWYGGAGRAQADSSKRKSIYKTADFAPAAALLRTAPPAPNSHPDHAYFAQTDPFHLRIEAVEALWEPIAEADDWTKLTEALRAIHEMGGAYGLWDEPATGMVLDARI